MPRIDSKKPVHFGYTGTLYVNYPIDQPRKRVYSPLIDIISRGNAFYWRSATNQSIGELKDASD